MLTYVTRFLVLLASPRTLWMAVGSNSSIQHNAYGTRAARTLLQLKTAQYDSATYRMMSPLEPRCGRPR